MKRRLFCLFLAVSLLLPYAFALDTTSPDMLAELIASTYPEGYVFDTTFDGGSGCYGFAKLIVNHLFGVSTEGKIRSWNYAGESSSGMLVLDRLHSGEYTEANMRAMMQKAYPGCVIQRNVDENGASQHSMIFLSAGKDSFLIYDCNSNYDNVVHIRSINYNAWEARTFIDVTLLIPDNYPDYTPQKPEFSSDAVDDADILSRLSAIMATYLPLGTTYSPESEIQPINRLFAREVLSTLFGGEYDWSETGNASETMLLVSSVLYGNYGDFALLRKTFSCAAPGDVIQLATGEFDRAHCMIFLSADEDGIWVYDADRQDDGVIRKRNIPYETRFHNGTWENISIFRAIDHPTPIIAPENDTPVFNEDNDDVPMEFSDVPDTHWAYPHIHALVRYGITRGRDEAHFAPDGTVTRAEFVTFLSRMTDNLEPGTGSTTLIDIPDDAWYHDAVMWANSYGIARGDDKGYFNPNMPVTREDLSVMLVRFLQLCEVSANDSKIQCEFNDSSKISTYAVDAINSLANSGIISGKSDGSFSPKDLATRAECAKILHKSMLIIEDA